MNYKRYRQYIAEQFGGLERDKLRDMLDRLVKLYVKEECLIEDFINKSSENKKINGNKFDNQKGIYVPSKERVEEEIHGADRSFNYKYKTNDLLTSIDLVEKSTMSDYNKALGIAKLARMFEGWHPITIIPTDLFHTFFDTIAEVTKYIIFDEEYQNFKVLEPEIEEEEEFED